MYFGNAFGLGFVLIILVIVVGIAIGLEHLVLWMVHHIHLGWT